MTSYEMTVTCKITPSRDVGVEVLNQFAEMFFSAPAVIKNTDGLEITITATEATPITPINEQ